MHARARSLRLGVVVPLGTVVVLGVVAFLGVVVLLGATPALAQSDPWINLNLVATEVDFQSGCSGFATLEEMPCEQLVGGPATGGAFVWVVATPSAGFGGGTNDVPQGLAGVQFGIEHDQEVAFWVSCGGLDLPSESWPTSGSGTAVAWSECYTPGGPTARVGYFYLPDALAGFMRLAPDPRDGTLAITDCRAFTYPICSESTGSLDVGSGSAPRCSGIGTAAPSNVMVTTDGDACTARVTWEHDGVGVDDFVVYVNHVANVVPPTARSFVDSTVFQGGTRLYRVSARADCMSAEASSATVEASFPIAALPTAFTATDDLCDRVTLTWQDEADDERGYTITRWNGGLVVTLGEVAPDVTTLTDTSAEPGVTYAYTIRAIGPCGVERGFAVAPGRRAAPPEQPTGLVASAGLCRLVALEWSDASDTETGFEILRDGALAGSLAANVESWVDSTAAPGVPYTYGVRAVSACDASPIATAEGTASDATPAAPAALTASDDLCLRVRLAWSDASADESGFEILRDGVPIARVAANVTAYEDSTTAVGVAHAYTVRALSACGAGAAAGPVIGVRTEETPPVGLVSAIAPAPGATCVPAPVTFAWRADPAADHYVLEILDACGGEPLVRTTTPDTSLALAPPLGPIAWRVRAVNGCGASAPPSTCRTLRVDPGPLAAPAAAYEYIGSTLWRLRWPAVPGAEHYEVATGAVSCPELDSGATVTTVSGRDTTLALGFDSWTAWVTAVACGERGTPSGCYGPGGPTPLALDYFRARVVAPGVELAWRTIGESSIRGFHVYREDGSGRDRVNTSLVPAGTGTYVLVDGTVPRGGGVDYVLVEVDGAGTEHELARAHVTPPALPPRLRIAARPNPFNPRVTLSISLPYAGRARVDILDVAGRHVRRLLEGRLERGTHALVWDGTDSTGRATASGVYFVRVVVRGESRAVRLVLLR